MKSEITLTFVKFHLSEILNNVENGKKYLIKRKGKIAAILSSYAHSKPDRKFGQGKGRAKRGNSFDEILGVF